MEDKTGNTPKQHSPGHYISGVVWGLVFGAAIGVAMNNVAIGIALSLTLGPGIGVSRGAKAKSKGKIRELTGEEKHKMERNLRLEITLGVIALIGVAVIAYF